MDKSEPVQGFISFLLGQLINVKILIGQQRFVKYIWSYSISSKTSKGLYRSCAALASFSGTFDLILFEAVNFGFIVEKVWFGLD